MIHRLLARVVLTAHIAYVVFVIFGGVLLFRWPGLLYLHVIAVVWGFATLAFDLGCPLTPWEKALLRRGGIDPYPEGFLQHHILRTRFAPEHSRRNHTLLGLLVLAINVALYSAVFLKG
jgi:uncharacterized protein DUF2784